MVYAMEKNPYSKLISDITISMGCDVGCPFIGRDFDDNWGLSNSAEQSDDVFKKVIEQIWKRIIKLMNHLYDPLKQRVNPLILTNSKREFVGIKMRVYRQTGPGRNSRSRFLFSILSPRRIHDSKRSYRSRHQRIRIWNDMETACLISQLILRPIVI